MVFKFNPFTGTLDEVGAGGGGSTSPGGSDTEIQFNNSGSFAGSADLTWDDTGKVLEVGGDIDLDDGGTYTTTLQTITPTAARTISFPDATGTVALVGGSSGQLVYNNAGAQAGAPGSVVGATGDITLSLNGAASTPPLDVTGTWFTGGTSTTTKPQVLIEPTGATSTAWSTSGTGLGVNAASGFVGRLLDLQVNGTSAFNVSSGGTISSVVGAGAALALGGLTFTRRSGSGNYNFLFFDVPGVSANKIGVINSGGSYGWGYLVANDGVGYIGFGDVFNGDFRAGFYSPANDTLEQRRGTNAQTFRVYNTLTGTNVGATGNYERGFLKWNSSVLELGTEVGSGGGTVRPVRITAATLKLPNLPTYADNAAALAGSLVAGDVYKTATGELRITV
jgi:hypothetical protein